MNILKYTQLLNKLKDFVERYPQKQKIASQSHADRIASGVVRVIKDEFKHVQDRIQSTNIVKDKPRSLPTIQKGHLSSFSGQFRPQEPENIDVKLEQQVEKAASSFPFILPAIAFPLFRFTFPWIPEPELRRQTNNTNRQTNNTNRQTNNTNKQTNENEIKQQYQLPWELIGILTAGGANLMALDMSRRQRERRQRMSQKTVRKMPAESVSESVKRNVRNRPRDRINTKIKGMPSRSRRMPSRVEAYRTRFATNTRTVRPSLGPRLQPPKGKGFFLPKDSPMRSSSPRPSSTRISNSPSTSRVPGNTALKTKPKSRLSKAPGYVGTVLTIGLVIFPFLGSPELGAAQPSSGFGEEGSEAPPQFNYYMDSGLGEEYIRNALDARAKQGGLFLWKDLVETARQVDPTFPGKFGDELTYAQEELITDILLDRFNDLQADLALEGYEKFIIDQEKATYNALMAKKARDTDQKAWDFTKAVLGSFIPADPSVDFFMWTDNRKKILKDRFGIDVAGFDSPKAAFEAHGINDDDQMIAILKDILHVEDRPGVRTPMERAWLKSIEGRDWFRKMSPEGREAIIEDDYHLQRQIWREEQRPLDQGGTITRPPPTRENSSDRFYIENPELQGLEGRNKAEYNRLYQKYL